MFRNWITAFEHKLKNYWVLLFRPITCNRSSSIQHINIWKTIWFEILFENKKLKNLKLCILFVRMHFKLYLEFFLKAIVLLLFSYNLFKENINKFCKKWKTNFLMNFKYNIHLNAQFSDCTNSLLSKNVSFRLFTAQNRN